MLSGPLNGSKCDKGDTIHLRSADAAIGEKENAQRAGVRIYDIRFPEKNLMLNFDKVINRLKIKKIGKNVVYFLFAV